MTQTVQKKLVTPNVKFFLDQSGKPWSEVKNVFQYDGKRYIPKTL